MKQLANPLDVTESLLRLRDEMLEKQNPAYLEIFWKINSCLYSKYPHTGEKNECK